MGQVGMFKIGDKVRVTEGESKGRTGTIEKFEEFGGVTYATLDSKPWLGHNVKCLELVKECKDMDIKINRKPPMTDVGQREAPKQLICKHHQDFINQGSLCNHQRYIDMAMEICRNDPQEIESIEIHITPEQLIDFYISTGGTIQLTLDQYNQIKQAVEGGK